MHQVRNIHGTTQLKPYASVYLIRSISSDRILIDLKFLPAYLLSKTASYPFGRGWVGPRADGDAENE